MEKLELKIPESLNSYRLDMACVKLRPQLSRRKIRKVIDLGGCYLNNRRVRIASKEVKTNDSILLQYSTKGLKTNDWPRSLSKSDILDISDDFIIVNKPAGLPIQETRDQAKFHLLPLLRTYLQEQGFGRQKLTLVHRLDKETTGVVVVARNLESANKLTEQFRERTVGKQYCALVTGLPLVDEFKVECQLRKNYQQNQMVQVVRQGGKHSETQFYVAQRFLECGLSLINCRPKTGRTHQIRVHLASKGYPILGDKIYGNRQKSSVPDSVVTAATHHMLHSQALEFDDPRTGKRLSFQAHLPSTFEQILGSMRND